MKNQIMQPSTTPKKSLKKLLSLFSVLGLGFIILSLLITTGYFDFQAMVIQARTRFDPAVDKLTDRLATNLNGYIKLPPNLMHNMTDDELFWRASLEPRVKNYPFKRVPKVAFMFLTRGPLPLHPLWERFFHGHDGLFSVYVHALPGYQPEFGRRSVFYRRQVPSKPAEWGRMSICEAEQRLLANALLDWSNERFVLLSESCIPLFPFPVVYKYLVEAHYSFVGSFIDPGPHGQGRYNPRMAPEVNASQWRKGSQWFEVQRELAVSIVSDSKYYPKFKQFCKPACYVDEHYFPTMLSIEAPNSIAKRSVTWVDWSRGGAHPATFGKNDITAAFLKRIKEEQRCQYNGNQSLVCFLFARKFARSALEPLLHYSSSVLGYN